MHGHMPLRFHVRGREAPGRLAHDDLLGTDYRGRVFGKALLRGATEKAPEFCGALWFNESNYRLYRKSGWTDVPRVLRLCKDFRAGLFHQAENQERDVSEPRPDRGKGLS